MGEWANGGYPTLAPATAHQPHLLPLEKSVTEIIRDTLHYVVRADTSRVYPTYSISCKLKNCYPRSKTVSQVVWDQLKGMSDKEFEGTCVLELGIGTYQND